MRSPRPPINILCRQSRDSTPGCIKIWTPLWTPLCLFHLTGLVVFHTELQPLLVLLFYMHLIASAFLLHFSSSIQPVLIILIHQ